MSSRVPYAALTATFSKIAATTKRLEISAYLTEFLVNVIEKTPEDLLETVYLCINRVSLLFFRPGIGWRGLKSDWLTLL